VRGRVLAQTLQSPPPPTRRQAAHTPVTKQAARSTEHTRNEQLIAERPVHRKEGTAAGGGRPADSPCAWPAGGCQRAVAEEATEAILRRIIHASHAHLASPSVPPPTTAPLPAHTQHIRSRHAIAQLSTWPRPYRFAASTRCVLSSISSLSCDNAQLWRCLLSLSLYLSTPGRFKHAASGRRNPLLSSPSEEGLVFPPLVSSRRAAHLISAVRLRQRLINAQTDRSLSGNVSRESGCCCMRLAQYHC
jgi:hypothetical protein